jgi:Domain of unknown function (DUF4258)
VRPVVDIPADPLAFIRDCVAARRILWTHHISMRLLKRGIGRDAILRSVGSYDVIECYPDDKYMPSYLVLARDGSEAIHILFATDVAGNNVRIVTAYHPNPNEWEPDLRKRKSP